MISEAGLSAIASCISAIAALWATRIAWVQTRESQRANDAGRAERGENLAKETRRAACALLEDIEHACAIADELMRAYNVHFNDAGSFRSSGHAQVTDEAEAIKEGAIALKPYAERIHTGQVALTGALVDEHANMLTKLEGDQRKVRSGTSVMLRKLTTTNTAIQVDSARKYAERLALAQQNPLNLRP